MYFFFLGSVHEQCRRRAIRLLRVLPQPLPPPAPRLQTAASAALQAAHLRSHRSPLPDLRRPHDRRHQHDTVGQASDTRDVRLRGLSGEQPLHQGFHQGTVRRLLALNST